MNAFPKAAAAAAILALAAGVAPAAEGDDLLRRADEIRAPGPDFGFTVEVETSDGATQAMSVTVKDRVKGLVQYEKPARMKGRAILFVGENMWVYVPGTRRPLRISPQQRVLGGVSSADVARTVFSEDYAVAAMSPAGEGHVLQLEPKTKGAAYARIDLTLDGDAAPRKAEFFAGGGRKLKTMTFEGYESVLGEMRPTRLVVIDHFEGDARTTMTYSGFRQTETPEAWYQPGYLSRL